MTYIVKKRDLLWATLAVLAILYALAIAGCGRGLVPAGAHEKSVSGGPGGALDSLAILATWIAGVGLLLCGVAAIWAPNKFAVAKVAICCVAIIGVSCLLHWLAGHTALLVGASAAVLLLSTVSYVWLHRVDVKKKTGIDLNWLCRIKAPKPSASGRMTIIRKP